MGIFGIVNSSIANTKKESQENPQGLFSQIFGTHLTPERIAALAQAEADYNSMYGRSWDELEKERAFSKAKRDNPQWYEGNRYIGDNVADHLAWREMYPDEAERAAQVGELPAIGLVRHGNILPGSRIPVQNSDGSYSTVRSMSVSGEDGYEYLIPTTAEDGSRILSDTEAIEQAKRTGHILGVFNSPDAATNYARAFHDRDAYLYDNGLDSYSRRKKKW